MIDTVKRIDEALADGFEVDDITSEPQRGVEVRLRKDDLMLTLTLGPEEARTLVYGRKPSLTTRV